jgi:23S rRNA pseudouridine2605 synthase
MVDDKPVRAPEPPRLFAFHKPDGLITAERDPAGRPTIYTALRNALPPGTSRMMPVGRLDLNTEGLLLLTNDGELKRAMELPATGIPRTYRARTFGEITQARLEELIEGVTIEGMNYGRIDANMERRTGRNQWIELTLTEGKNREVRRVLEHLGLQVSRLIRVAYGPFLLGELPRGAAVEIRQKDVEQFRKSLKLAPAERGEATREVPPAGDAPVSRAPGRSAARPADKPAARRDGHASARPDRRDPQEKRRRRANREKRRTGARSSIDRPDAGPRKMERPKVTDRAAADPGADRRKVARPKAAPHGAVPAVPASEDHRR